MAKGRWLVRAKDGRVRFISWDKTHTKKGAITLANIGNDIVECRLVWV